MIVNAYSVIAAFVALVELALGAVVAILGLSAIRARRRAGPASDAGESRFALLFLQASVLLGVGVASWPLLYLVLCSYVPEWPGVMCIRGVVRIGTGSLGAPGLLPTLLAVLEVTKPALVFATGAWLVLHLANRRTRTAPLAGRVLVALAAAGFLAAVDGAAQLAYLGIPKQERFLARGCCNLPSEVASRSGGGASFLSLGGPEASRSVLTAAFFGLLAALAFGSWWAARRPGRRPVLGRFAPAVPLLGAALSVPLGVAFLSDVAAPAFLGVSDHPCAYCALGSSRLFVAAVVLFLLGVFATGWASLARWFAASDETRAFLPAQVSRLSYAAAFGYAGAILVVAARLATS